MLEATTQSREAAVDGAAATQDERDAALRAGAYGLLGALLAGPPGQQQLDALARIEIPTGGQSPGDEFSSAWASLRDAAGRAEPPALDDEYHDLFIGVGRGELVPFGSWYLTGAMMDSPLAALRADLAELGFSRREGVSETEDHAGALLQTMSLLIHDGEALATQRRLFEAHVAPWMIAFFDDLVQASAARFYRSVGEFGGRFIRFERSYLTMLA